MPLSPLFCCHTTHSQAVSDEQWPAVARSDDSFCFCATTIILQLQERQRLRCFPPYGPGPLAPELLSHSFFSNWHFFSLPRQLERFQTREATQIDLFFLFGAIKNIGTLALRKRQRHEISLASRYQAARMIMGFPFRNYLLRIIFSENQKLKTKNQKLFSELTFRDYSELPFEESTKRCHGINESVSVVLKNSDLAISPN